MKRSDFPRFLPEEHFQAVVSREAPRAEPGDLPESRRGSWASGEAHVGSLQGRVLKRRGLHRERILEIGRALPSSLQMC